MLIFDIERFIWFSFSIITWLSFWHGKKMHIYSKKQTNKTKHILLDMQFLVYMLLLFFLVLWYFPTHKKPGQHFKCKNISPPIKICHFGKQRCREQSANVTAFCGTGLADFTWVAWTQVLSSHTRSLPHTVWCDWTAWQNREMKTCEGKGG